MLKSCPVDHIELERDGGGGGYPFLIFRKCKQPMPWVTNKALILKKSQCVKSQKNFLKYHRKLWFLPSDLPIDVGAKV